jgi:hypothetical protein
VSPFKRHLAVCGILMGVLQLLLRFLSEGGPKTPEDVILDFGFIVFLTVIMVILARCLPLGYSAYGVTDASFRDGLVASLTSLNLTHDETSTGLRLLTIGADLRAKAPESRWRAGFFDMKQPGFDRLLCEIATGINEYYRSGGRLEVNMDCFRMRVLLAVLSALVTGLIFWSKFSNL